MTLNSILQIALLRQELRGRGRERLVGFVIRTRRDALVRRRIVGGVNREDTYVNMNLQVGGRGGAYPDIHQLERAKTAIVLEQW